MKIAVEGCAHGELEKIYESILFLQEKEGIKVDLLLCCGDFQAVRNRTDLECMAVPPKYRQIETFYKYYSGEKVAPVLTIFIGGNHEASNHLWELPHGGWVAPNIYYLGYSGVVSYGGFRISGLSGIFKPHDYRRGHYECPPYDGSTMRSAYHVRSFDVFKLKLLSQPLDIAMSHDWPQGVYHYGDLNKLYRYKGFLQHEIESNTLGSPPAMEILNTLQPTYWFSAHLHVKFPALITHESKDNQLVKCTKFLALDKCLPRRDFLQVIDLGPIKGPQKLCYDAEWLAIIKLTNPLINITSGFTMLPSNEEEIARYKPNPEIVAEVMNQFGDLEVPNNFVQTVEPYDPLNPKKMISLTNVRPNPQTEQFCSKLCIKNSYLKSDVEISGNPDEIELDDDEEDVVNDEDIAQNNSSATSNIPNPEISEQDESNQEKITETSDDSAIDTQEQHDLELDTEMQSSVDDKTCDDNTEPKTKVIKLSRRNQAIYTHDDEENEPALGDMF